MAISDAPTTGLVEQVKLTRRLPPAPVAKAIRAAAGVSQQQVADELGVDRVTVARWEGGQRRPRGALLSRYVDLLDALREAASG